MEAPFEAEGWMITLGRAGDRLKKVWREKRASLKSLPKCGIHIDHNPLGDDNAPMLYQPPVASEVPRMREKLKLFSNTVIVYYVSEYS